MCGNNFKQHIVCISFPYHSLLVIELFFLLIIIATEACAIYLSIIYLFLQICYACSGATSLPNNMILDCEECGKTVHQKCARPEITASQAKDPRFLFVCSDCKDREVWIYHLNYRTVIRPKFGYVGTSIYFVTSFLLTASIFYVFSWSKNAYVTSSLALPQSFIHVYNGNNAIFMSSCILKDRILLTFFLFLIACRTRRWAQAVRNQLLISGRWFFHFISWKKLPLKAIFRMLDFSSWSTSWSTREIFVLVMISKTSNRRTKMTERNREITIPSYFLTNQLIAGWQSKLAKIFRGKSSAFKTRKWYLSDILEFRC